MTTSSPRISIVSLDGATFDVLAPLAEAGVMPILKKFMDTAAVGELESTVPPLTAPAWSSFMTGKQPGKHGVWEFRLYDPATDRDYLANARTIRGRTLWQMLSDAGKHICVFNLPFTYPPYPVNGVLISGFDMPSRFSRFTHPPELREKILELVPDYTFSTSAWAGHPIRSDREFREFMARINKGYADTCRIALHLLETGDWDVFMVHFQDLDFLQHRLWNEIVGAINPTAGSQRAEAIRSSFRNLDECMGAVFDRCRAASTTEIILSDHGFGKYRQVIHLNELLASWGMLASVVPGGRASLAETFRERLKATESASLRLVMNGIRRARIAYSEMRNRKERKRRATAGEFRGVDRMAWEQKEGGTNPLARKLGIEWPKTKVIAATGSNVGFLFVNVRGRGSHGIVEPGREYQALIEDLRRRFADMRHPEHGEPLFALVGTGDEIYGTVDGVAVPDLMVIPADGYTVSRELAGRLFGPAAHQGTHRRNGIFLARGHGIRCPAPVTGARIVDVAPTILHLLGCPIPRDMDGRVLEELLRDKRAVVFEDGDDLPAAPGRPGDSYSADEEAVVTERLRGLGYL